MISGTDITAHTQKPTRYTVTAISNTLFMGFSLVFPGCCRLCLKLLLCLLWCTFTGGLKTEAGIDRVVPIHPLIFSLVEANYKKALAMGSEYLFNDENGQQGTYLTYDKYRGRFKKVMKRVNQNHKPHDTRHTFITKGKYYQMDDYILKMIVGHAINDVTEKTYTHRVIEELRREIEKIIE